MLSEEPRPPFVDRANGLFPWWLSAPGDRRRRMGAFLAELPNFDALIARVSMLGPAVRLEGAKGLKRKKALVSTSWLSSAKTGT